MPSALRIPWRGHMLLEAIFLEKLHQIFPYELLAVVCDNELRDAESANDVPPYEVLYVRLSCGCQRLCFHPFSEVVSEGNILS